MCDSAVMSDIYNESEEKDNSKRFLKDDAYDDTPSSMMLSTKLKMQHIGPRYFRSMTLSMTAETVS